MSDASSILRQLLGFDTRSHAERATTRMLSRALDMMAARCRMPLPHFRQHANFNFYRVS